MYKRCILITCSLATIAPLYISEIAPPEIRGALLVLQEFSIVLGIVIAFWTTYGTRFMTGEWSWRLPFLIQMIPGLVLGVGIVFLPFSPRWLASKGRDDEALVVLGKLRKLPTDDPRIFQEWCEIRAEVTFNHEVSVQRHPELQAKTRKNEFKLEVQSWLDCFRHGCWKRTVVGVGIMFFQQFVGMYPVSSSKETTNNNRHQRSHLLLALSLRNTRPGLRNAASAFWHHQLHAARWCCNKSVDYGSLWTPTVAPCGCCSHVHLPSHHRRLGWQVWWPMAGLRSGRLGCCRLPILLHVQLRSYLGTSPMGYALRDFPVFVEGEGCRTLNVFELVQQLHHCRSTLPL